MKARLVMEDIDVQRGDVGSTPLFSLEEMVFIGKIGPCSSDKNG
jgi:hypothetical protein